MQTIQPVRMEDAGGSTRRLFETLKTEHGDISNMLKTMAQSPGALEGYLSFVRALEQTSGLSQSNYYYKSGVSIMCPSLLSRSHYPNNSVPI